jgi:methylglutaconyl-CoA hydratase
MAEGLRLDLDGPTLTATIDAGEGNLFSREMMDAFLEAIADASQQERLRFLRIRAEGAAFCLGRQKGGTSLDEVRGMAAKIPAINEALRTSPLTVIAEVQGDAAGFGVGLVAASDVTVAADGATFAFPEILSGFAPAVIVSWARFVVPPRLLFDMVSTGDPIDAPTARDAGIVTEVVEPGRLRARVDERIARLTSADAYALKELKRFLVHTRTMDPGTAASAAVDNLTISALRVIGDF